MSFLISVKNSNYFSMKMLSIFYFLKIERGFYKPCSFHKNVNYNQKNCKNQQIFIIKKMIHLFFKEFLVAFFTLLLLNI